MRVHHLQDQDQPSRTIKLATTQVTPKMGAKYWPSPMEGMIQQANEDPTFHPYSKESKCIQGICYTLPKRVLVKLLGLRLLRT